ncbi:MAG: hypothetical protein AAFQ43_07435, partial [Bacteroidota bacterium]
WLARPIARFVFAVADEDYAREVNAEKAVQGLLLFTVIAGAVVSVLTPAASVPLLAAFWAVMVAAVPLAVIGIAGHVLARLVAVVVSRQREHHADALAVELTRFPEALVGALEAVERQPMGGHVIFAHRARLDHFFFARPTVDPPALDALVPHPPLIDRARRVRSDAFRPAPTVPRQRPTRQRPTSPRPARPGAALAALQQPLAALPTPLLDACHDDVLAPLAVLAVLAAEGRTPEAEARRAFAAADVDANAVLALATALPSGADLLPAVEVAMPALRRLDGPDRQRLAGAVRALIAADHETTLAEAAILQMLRWGFSEAPTGRASGGEIAQASDTLFAVLAAAGSPLGSDRAQAVRAGRRALRSAIRLPDAPEARPRADPDALGAALGTLRRASGVRRHAVLDAAHAVVTADGLTKRDEAALLRATALALGVACVVHLEEDEARSESPVTDSARVREAAAA